MMRCKRCGVEKPDGEYYDRVRISGIGKTGICKACHRARVAEWRHANPDKARLKKRGNPSGVKRVRDPEKMRAYNKRYNATDKARAARKRFQQGDKFKAIQRRSAQRNRWPRDIKERYGISVEDYAWMLYGQNFCCAICNHELPKELVSPSEQRKKNRPCIDHCHDTGRVRGILCSGCNYSIVGALESGGDVQIVRAMRYLGWHATKASGKVVERTA
jgi:hypothetical protein